MTLLENNQAKHRFLVRSQSVRAALSLFAFSTCLLSPLLALDVQAQERSIPGKDLCASPDKSFTGPCFAVHARLQEGADSVVIWIWPVGTKRYLGFLGDCYLPDDLASLVIGKNKTVYADLMVRPLSRPRPGYMQFVCIASASHLVIRD